MSSYPNGSRASGAPASAGTQSAPALSPLALYEIDVELAALEAELIANGGEITEEAEEVYHDLLTMRADKVAGYVAVIRRCELSADAVDAELDRLKRNRDALKNTAQRLKDRLCFAMIGRGDKEHVIPLGKVRVQQASRRPLHLLVEPDDLPARFRRVSVSADKTALAAALDALDEEAVQLAEYGPASTFLRIY